MVDHVDFWVALFTQTAFFLSNELFMQRPTIEEMPLLRISNL